MPNAIAVIIGAAIAALVQLLTQLLERQREKRRLERDDRVRLYNERRELYTRFVRLAGSITKCTPTVNVSEEILLSLEDVVSDLLLISSHSTFCVGLAFQAEVLEARAAIIQAMSDAYEAGKDSPEDARPKDEGERSKRLNGLYLESVQAFRKDLGVN